MPRIRGVFLLAFLVLVTPLAAPAGELVTIGKLLADPQPYHVSVVTLQGTAHQLQILQDPPEKNPRLDFQCYMVHPPYTFVLADDTGFMQIHVAARPPCVSPMSPAEPPDVSEGDKVAVEAQITVGNQYSGGENRRTIHALAKAIRRLGN